MSSGGRHRVKTALFSTSGESVESPDTSSAVGVTEAPPAVIPSQGDLLGDLLNLDLTPPTTTGPPPPSSGMQMGAMDLLGGGLDSLVSLVHLKLTAYMCNFRPFFF